MDVTSQRNKLILITVLITMAVTSVVWLGIGGLGYWVVSRDSPEFTVEAEHPDTVMVGDVFHFKVSITNDSTRRMKLADLDLYEDFTNGFEILSVNPRPRSTSKMFGFLTHEFARKLAPAETFDIVFEMKAQDSGVWGGDIDACTPTQNFVTHYTEIEVLEPPVP